MNFVLNHAILNYDIIHHERILIQYAIYVNICNIICCNFFIVCTSIPLHGYITNGLSLAKMSWIKYSFASVIIIIIMHIYNCLRALLRNIGPYDVPNRIAYCPRSFLFFRAPTSVFVSFLTQRGFLFYYSDRVCVSIYFARRTHNIFTIYVITQQTCQIDIICCELL